MERIAILDHVEHRLFVEDIDDDVLNTQYGSEEEIPECWCNVCQERTTFKKSTRYLLA